MILLSLGSNLGNAVLNLSMAINEIELSGCKIISTSKIFETQSWLQDEQNNYLNRIIHIETVLSPKDLLNNVLYIEKKMGRIRKKKWGSRLIDIDILFYNDMVINTIDLSVPYPHLHHRNFILDILIDMGLANLIHPVFNLNIQQIKNQCNDTGKVYLPK